MIDDPLGNKTLASIDSDYFRSLLPKTVAGRGALDAAASEIEREIAGIEAQQKKLLQSSIQPSRALTRALSPKADGSDPLAYLTGSTSAAAGPWDGIRQAVSGYDNLAFSEQQRLYDEFVKQEAARTGQKELDIRMATKDGAPAAPTRTMGELGIDVLAGLGAGVTGMGSTITDLIAPDSDASRALHERVATLNAMQSPVEQNTRKEVAAELARFKAENPDAGALETFGEEALATAGNLSAGTVANLAGSLAASGGIAGRAAKGVAAARAAGGATAAEAALAGRLAGTAAGSGIAGVSTGGEVRGDFYQQVMGLPVSDPNLQANEDFQKYLAEERGDVDPNAPDRSPIAERAAQLRARERLALDSKGAAAVAGLLSAGLAGFGPEAVIAKAAARRAAAEATGDTVGAATKVLGKLDNAVGRLPVTVAAEGVDEGLPTVAANVNFQNVDPTRGALEGAGGDVVLGMLGGGVGQAIGVVENSAAQQPQPARPVAAPDATATPVVPETNERVTVTETPDGPAYSVRGFDDSVIEIPAGPDAEQQARQAAQDAIDELESLDQPEPAPVAEPAAAEPIPTPAGWDSQYATPEEMAAAARENRLPNAPPPPPGYTPTPVAEPAAAEPAAMPLDRPTVEDLPAPTPAPQVVTQEMANEMGLQEYETNLINSIRADGVIAEGDAAEVMQAVDSGAFSPLVGLVLRDLQAENWLGFDSPWAALDAALFADAANPVPPKVAESVAALRQKIRSEARAALDNEGVPREFQDRVGQPIPVPAAGAAIPEGVAANPTQENAPAPIAPDAEDTPQREAAIAQARSRIVQQTVGSEFMSGSSEEIVQHTRSVGMPQPIHALINKLAAANWLGYPSPRDALEAALTFDPATGIFTPDMASVIADVQGEMQQRAITNVDNAAATAPAPAAEVPTLTDSVVVPATEAIPATGPLTQVQATAANDAINANLFLDEIRNDVRLELTPPAVMRLAENGNSFSPELSNLLRGLNDANWLGYATPLEAVTFALSNTETPATLPQTIAASAQVLRARAREYGSQRTRDRGIRVEIQRRVSQPGSSSGPAQPGVEQAPSLPLRNLSLSDAAAKALARAVQPFARDPLPAVRSIGATPTPEARRDFFMRTFRRLLSAKGFRIARNATPSYFNIIGPSGASVSASVQDRGGGVRRADGTITPNFRVGTTTTGFTAGSEEGSHYYSALNAAAVAAGLPLYNGSYTSVNTTRLPINRLKGLLQALGVTTATPAAAARNLGLNARALGADSEFPLDNFNNIAQHVILNAESHFPNATASNMTGGSNQSNYLTGVLRLNPDGTFDTPAGVMTAGQLKNWTRVNNEGSPRYANNQSDAFGASSYSSMALAAMLRSYMEATTDAQRVQVRQAVETLSTQQDRAHAFLDVTDPASTPAESNAERRKPLAVEQALRKLNTGLRNGTLTQEQYNQGQAALEAKLEMRRLEQALKDAFTPRVRGLDMAMERLINARRTGALPSKTVDFMLWLLNKNPALANDLSFSVKPTRDGAGQYNPVERIVQLFSGANDGTGVHEILHHTERMLPKVARQGILKAYNAALTTAMKKATPEQQKAIMQLIKDSSGLGGEGAADRMQQVFSDGTLNYDEHYQLANPSEFWAVNATRLLQGRQGRTGWTGRARTWLQGFVQKAKSLLGLSNDNAALQGIQAVLKGDGSFVSNLMLAQDNEGRLTTIFNDVPSGDNNPPSAPSPAPATPAPAAGGPATPGAANDQTAPRDRAGFDQIMNSISTRTTLPAASPERALVQALDNRQITEPGQVRKAMDARAQQLNEAFHDHLAPVERLFTEIGDESPELLTLGEAATGAMRMAPGVRDEIMRQMIEDHGGNALFSTLEEIARTQGMTKEDAIGYVGYWLTAQRAPTANARLIAQDAAEVERLTRLHAQAEQAVTDARNNPNVSDAELQRAERELVDMASQLAKATKQLTNRRLAVNNTRTTGLKRHVAGVAGFNNAQAAAMAANVEQHIPKEMLQKAADSVYDLNAFRLVADLESGRASPETVANFLDKPEIAPLLQQLVDASDTDAQQEGSQANRDALREQVAAAVRSDYVPLTGNPQTALYEDSPAGGSTQPNTGRTYAMEGRQDSMPDDGVTATLAGLIRSASHAGWAPFQDAVAKVYEQMTPKQRDDHGIHRESRLVTDRTTGSNNAALVRLRGGVEQRYTFKNDKILKAIHNETIADTDAALGGIAKLTRLYAWAATQFNLPFAPRNMVRDFGERADTLLSKDLRDAQGNKIPSGQVVKAMLKYGTTGLPRVLNAGLRFALNGTAGGKSKESQYLRELQESGALSTYGARFQNSRMDFIKQINSAKSSNKKLKALSKYTVELWNRPFDFAAPLASYMAMRESGVAKEQAQTIALDLMNFRKRGTQMKTVSAVLPFAQTGVTGGVNMARSLMDLRKGKIKPYAVARMAGYVLALSALRAMFMAAADDDEGGNKLAQLPDYEHENNILIPFDDGVMKIPLPFGLMRLANGIVNNTLGYAGNEKTGKEAFSNMMLGSVVPAFAPISESPLDGSKYPIQKLLLTLSPPVIKPFVQAATGLTAFGAPLKNEYADKDKFISDQPKLNTPAAYTTMAQSIREWTGADVPPEVVREIVKGYPLGVLNYARSGMLEDKEVAGELRKPFFAPYPEAARYFQFKKAFDDASTELKKVERGDTDYDPAKIAWLKDYEKGEDAIQGKISSVTKKKGLTDAVKEEQKAQLRLQRSATQNAALYKWRTEILKAEAKRTGE